MTLSAKICFKSEKFDYQSELPDEYNAGNRFYGKDLAEFLATRLTELGFAADYLDEDWGWLVSSVKGTSPEFEVAVYNLAEHGEGGKPGVGEWGLWIHSYERTKLLGLLPRRTKVQVPAQVLEAARAAVESIGAQAQPWRKGPGDA